MKTNKKHAADSSFYRCCNIQHTCVNNSYNSNDTYKTNATTARIDIDHISRGLKGNKYMLIDEVSFIGKKLLLKIDSRL